MPADFEETEKVRASGLSNKTLYEELLDISGGDDYDGCFTQEGVITYNALKSEFETRLKDWLNTDPPTGS